MWVATQDPPSTTFLMLHRVQQGLDPDDWRPMPTIGPGVREILIHTELEHRVFYVATSRMRCTCYTRSRSARARHPSAIWTSPAIASVPS
jgi:hypothetical protein